jgi:membrane protein required for colicin V production
MTILDWVLVVVWLGLTLAGFWKGAIRIVFGCGGLVLGIWLAVVVGDELVILVSRSVDQAMLAAGLAYLLPVVVVSGLCLLAGWGMEKTLEALKLGCLNRLLGALLVGTAAACMLAVLLVSAVRISPEVAAIEERSVLLAKVRSVLAWATVDQEFEAPTGRDEPGDVDGDSSDR